MKDFIAIDFETANECPSSVCSIGAVLVRDGKITNSFYSLIRPEPEYYKWFCQKVHGITPEDTEDAPVFPHVWHRMVHTLLGDPGCRDAELMSEDHCGKDGTLLLPFVAHNCGFDEKCLKSVFNVYRMDYPGFVFMDTLDASRRHFGRCLPNHRLPTVAAVCGFDLSKHHHALADAEACAHIAIKIM
ncbi:MAG: 3'-5' exonuclease [Bacteroidales bacterium]|nr:3'-5' exonuclease [Bacteroidales bacterium]MDE5954932.1 3'-5' exonuclease [Bacteroidales bacterium]